jgi:hypothetical protein
MFVIGHFYVLIVFVFPPLGSVGAAHFTEEAAMPIGGFIFEYRHTGDDWPPMALMEGVKRGVITGRS